MCHAHASSLPTPHRLPPPPRLQFAVQYDARAAPPLDRMAVINAFATRIEVNVGCRCLCIAADVAGRAPAAGHAQCLLCCLRRCAVVSVCLQARAHAHTPQSLTLCSPAPPAPSPLHLQKPHSVNLGAPQKTVLVNVLKSTLGVAVVEQFKELCRFNIRRWAGPCVAVRLPVGLHVGLPVGLPALSKA